MNSPLRLTRLAVVAVALVTASAGVTAHAEPGDPGTVGNVVEAVPRAQRVTVFSDSVGLGARASIPAAFPPSWEVNVVGEPARFVEQLENGPCFWTLTNQRCDVRYRLAANPDWFGDHVVIAAGYNYPYWDPARFDRSVDSIIDTLTAAGVKHVYWVTLREIDPQYISASAWRQVQPYYWYFPEVNDHLEAALDRHPNLTLVDWAAHANQPGLTYDAIHLNPTGAALYARLVREAVDATATTVADGSTTKIHVPGGEGAVAAAVNLTTTNPRRNGHLTVHRCDESPPNTSVHNFVRGQVVAHAAIAPLDAAGNFCVTTITQTNLVVDVSGLFGPGHGFTTLHPTRWADTRSTGKVAAGSTLALDVHDVRARAGIVGDPAALALVVTAVGGEGLGHVTVSPCGVDANHSNVNFGGAAPTPNLVIAAPDADGRICLFAVTTTHLLVDVFGSFDETADVSIGTPSRLFDSRTTGAPVPGQTSIRIDVGAELASAEHGAILNLTGARAQSPGHFTAYPCAGGKPDTSSLNVTPGAAVANAVIVRPDADGAVCVATHSTAHVVVDLLGEVGAAFTGFRPVRVLDTRAG